MRILVTGAAGFIGSHYVREVLAGSYPESADVHVTVLDRLTYAGRRENLPAEHERFTFVRGDICDRDLLDRVVPGHDAIVHFAAESHVDRSVTAPGEFIRTNVTGTQQVLDAALQAGVDRVLHVSTDEVYGSVETGTWTEDSPLLPNSPYAASKASSDLVARAYHRTHGLDVRITRCSNNYGPYQHPEKLIPNFVTRLLTGRHVPLYGDGRNVREWLHVDDHCRALHLVLTKGRAGEVYNIGGGSGLSNREMTGRLLALLGADWDMVRHVEDRPGHDFRYAIDDSKIREELGYAPRWSIESGLEAVVNWYRDHPGFWRTPAS
ncbi:dTDP-glucose 4,6-dehydratase [Streptomyces sp. SID486]|uniref:dTDP-glucose 4,6-dehydratase n=1 Tax=unclassified Streptomyces TaxID=2593676 RepID=UPI00136B8B3D|nr:dTDP-glucose 4,6-dehydratase [Streptomyces sp. SID486]MYW17782.1 dTDP-glucose 4,6-dehydratase [Streptomyces sp. SID2955]MYX97262.1 dTDP-glucose 4,6-dehydratase [Streptomyces sp. SID486]